MIESRFCDPMPPYIMIKIPKQEQRDKREKLTEHILAAPALVFMQREIQFGEILKIGEGAAEYLPQAEIGDYLLIHHFISGKKSDRGYNFYLIDEDGEFNYYMVNVYELPGERSLAYGVAKGTEVIPTKDYILLDVEKEEISDTEKVVVQSVFNGESDIETEMNISSGGLFVSKSRKKSREEWTAIMKHNMARIKQLARNIPHGVMEEILTRENPEKRAKSEYAISEIKKLEAINAAISKDINKRKYEPFKVAALNPEWNESIERSFGEKIEPGDTIYMLNQACHCHIDIGDTEFIIAEVKYFAGSYNYFKNVINQFKSSRASLHSSKAKRGTAKARN